MKKATIIEDRFEDMRINLIIYGNKVRIALFSDPIWKEKVNWEVRMFEGIYHLSGAVEYKEIIIKLKDEAFNMRNAFRTENEYNMWVNRNFDEVECFNAWEI